MRPLPPATVSTTAFDGDDDVEDEAEVLDDDEDGTAPRGDDEGGRVSGGGLTTCGCGGSIMRTLPISWLDFPMAKS